MNRPCYHCHQREASEHSNFCAPCRGTNRPLHYPPAPQQASLLTRLLWLGAFASLAWLVFKTAEYVMQQP